MLVNPITALLLILGQAPTRPPVTRSEAPPSIKAKTSPATDSNSDIALWLVNLARHQGHLVGRSDPRSASLHVLAILEAAVSVDPQCAEAYYWLYDIQQRLGQS